MKQYADDTILLEEALIIFQVETNKLGLEISWAKTLMQVRVMPPQPHPYPTHPQDPTFAESESE